MFVQSSVDSKQGTFTKPFKSTSAKGPQIESTEDRAQHCFKNEWTLTVQALIFPLNSAQDSSS